MPSKKLEDASKRVDGFRARLFMILAVRSAVSLLIVYGFIWGTAVLVLRSGWDLPRAPLAFG